MKKTIAVILMVAAFVLPAKAQLSWGIQAGVNMANISIKDVSASMKSRTGFFVGPTATLSLPISGLGLDASILYDHREGRIDDGSESKTVIARTVQVPINVRYGWGIGSMAKVFLFAGPQFGYNVGGKESTLNSSRESLWTLKTSHVSANVGIGLSALNHLQLKFNYNFALSTTGEFKLRDIGSSEEHTVGSARINAWQVSLAYLF